MKTWLLFAGACAGVLTFAACSSSDPSPAQPFDAGTIDAGGDDVVIAPEAAADAGPDVVDQDPNVYPSKHQPIPQADNNGGPLIDHPKLVTVTFVGDPLRDQLRAFAHTIGSTPWWHQTIGTYGIADATNGGDFELPDTISHQTMLDSDFAALVNQQVAVGALPAPDAQTLYLFYIPATTIIDDRGAQTCRDNGGYHSTMVVAVSASVDGGASDAGSPPVEVAYAMLPRCAPQISGMTVVASHEIGEAVTDPKQIDTAINLVSNDAWIPVFFGGIYGEIGDLCSVLPLGDTYLEGTYQVQRLWSNAAAMASKNPCQPATKPYFGAAVRTTPRIVGGKKKDGHVAVKRGESVDAIIDFFSEAPLSQDVTLKVGMIDIHGSFKPLPSGVTVALSRTTVHNGNTVVMTTTAAKNAAAAALPLAVRATLTPSDFNDWPVILSVL